MLFSKKKKIPIFIQTHEPTQNSLNLDKSWPNPIKYLG